MNNEDIEFLTRHTYGSWTCQKLWKDPPYIVEAEGVYFYDINGKRYIDFSSQLMCSNLGHKNQTIINAFANKLKNCNIHPLSLHVKLK